MCWALQEVLLTSAQEVVGGALPKPNRDHLLAGARDNPSCFPRALADLPLCVIFAGAEASSHCPLPLTPCSLFSESRTQRSSHYFAWQGCGTILFRHIYSGTWKVQGQAVVVDRKPLCDKVVSAALSWLVLFRWCVFNLHKLKDGGSKRQGRRQGWDGSWGANSAGFCQ